MEQLGEKLIVALIQKYPGREWEVRVMGDDEDGAIIRYDDAS